MLSTLEAEKLLAIGCDLRLSKKILIIEDEDSLRRNLEIFLGEHGHRVSCAAGGEDAVRLLHHEQFDIVIIDIPLGDMEGLDLVRRIMARSSLMGVLVMTAYNSVDSILSTRPFERVHMTTSSNPSRLKISAGRWKTRQDNARECNRTWRCLGKSRSSTASHRR